MIYKDNFEDLSFLVYGLGITGQSVVNYFEKHKIKNYLVWDDKNKNLYKKKRSSNINKTLKMVNYIVLSPGVSLKKSINKNQLVKYKSRIITDIDIIFLLNKTFQSIVITGTNGKSTTCKIIYHLLKKNRYKVLLGGNIGTPILNLDIKNYNYLIIEASSFQLAHSKFIQPDYAILLNITDDHLEWHGSKRNYINSKLKIFNLQKKKQYAFVNSKFIPEFKKRKFLGRLITPKKDNYLKIKSKVNNSYIKLNINDENMSYVFSLSKLLKINEKSFLRSLNTFKGLPHRYEIFLKKKNCIFINDSKATSFQATKVALESSKNIYWIVGGLPKKNDKINLKKLRKNIIKSYIIGKNVNFFKKQLKNKVSFFVAKSLKSSIVRVLRDIKLFNKKNNTILFSPASASFDQFLNFEKRGEKFKELSKYYARKYI